MCVCCKCQHSIYRRLILVCTTAEALTQTTPTASKQATVTTRVRAECKYRLFGHSLSQPALYIVSICLMMYTHTTCHVGKLTILTTVFKVFHSVDELLKCASKLPNNNIAPTIYLKTYSTIWYLGPIPVLDLTK